MVITLRCLTDIYSKPNKEGVQKITKRNVEFKKQFESSMILIEQHINSKGTPSKKWCTVKMGEEYFRVNHKFEELEKLNSHMTVRGFRW